MGIRVVIVDDEKPARDRVRRLLGEHDGFEVVGQAGDVATAAETIDRERPDLCFLDVRMPGGDGFEVLRRVRHVPRIVFTTAFDEYAVRAFEVGSLDYLLKPFDRKRFAAALERVRRSLAKEAEHPSPELRSLLERLQEGRPAIPAPDRAPERIPARRGNRIVLLDPEEVLCFEADDTLVYARTPGGRVMVERTLAELEEQLSERFFRTHRSFLVNLARIGEILPEDAGTFRIVLKDEAGTQVPLSRRQARRLRERIPW